MTNLFVWVNELNSGTMNGVHSTLFYTAPFLVLLLSSAIRNVCADSPDLSSIVPAILDLDPVRTRINRQFKDLGTTDGELLDLSHLSLFERESSCKKSGNKNSNGMKHFPWTSKTFGCLEVVLVELHPVRVGQKVGQVLRPPTHVDNQSINQSIN